MAGASLGGRAEGIPTSDPDLGLDHDLDSTTATNTDRVSESAWLRIDFVVLESKVQCAKVRIQSSAEVR